MPVVEGTSWLSAQRGARASQKPLTINALGKFDGLNDAQESGFQQIFAFGASTVKTSPTTLVLIRLYGEL